MKKPFLISILFIFILIIFNSCSEEESIDPETTIEQQINDIYNTYLIIQKDKPNVILRLSLKDNKLVSFIEAPDNANLAYRNAFTPEEPKLLCEGSGISFAKCVKKLLDAGKCIVLTTCAYCAYEADCP